MTRYRRGSSGCGTASWSSTAGQGRSTARLVYEFHPNFIISLTLTLPGASDSEPVAAKSGTSQQLVHPVTLIIIIGPASVDLRGRTIETAPVS